MVVLARVAVLGVVTAVVLGVVEWMCSGRGSVGGSSRSTQSIAKYHEVVVNVSTETQ